MFTSIIMFNINDKLLKLFNENLFYSFSFVPHFKSNHKHTPGIGTAGPFLVLFEADTR